MQLIRVCQNPQSIERMAGTAKRDHHARSLGNDIVTDQRLAGRQGAGLSKRYQQAALVDLTLPTLCRYSNPMQPQMTPMTR